ncbi:MAG: hypothetical protein ACRCSG_08755 [Cellulosilyticaceae bacterium]
MIFDNLIFPNNPKKQKTLDSLKKDLVTLFSSYKTVWNELSLQMSPYISIPTLNSSIEVVPIEECLNEINNAITSVDILMHNLSVHLELQKFIITQNIKPDDVNKKLMIKILKLIPTLANLSIAKGIGYIGGILLLKWTSAENILLAKFNQELSVISERALQTYTTNDFLLTPTILQKISKNIQKIYSNNLTFLHFRFSNLIKKNNTPLTESIKLQYRNSYLQNLDTLFSSIDSNSKCITKKLAFQLSSLDTECALSNSSNVPLYFNSLPDNQEIHNLIAPLARKLPSRFITIHAPNNTAPINIEILSLKNSEVGFYTSSTSSKYYYDTVKKTFLTYEHFNCYRNIESTFERIQEFSIFKNTILSELYTNASNLEITSISFLSKLKFLITSPKFWIGIILFSGIASSIIELLNSFFFGLYYRKKLDNQIKNILSIFSDLKIAMEKEISNIRSFIQDVKDGIISIDKEHFLIKTASSQFKLATICKLN